MGPPKWKSPGPVGGLPLNRGEGGAVGCADNETALRPYLAVDPDDVAIELQRARRIRGRKRHMRQTAHRSSMARCCANPKVLLIEARLHRTVARRRGCWRASPREAGTPARADRQSAPSVPTGMRRRCGSFGIEPPDAERRYEGKYRHHRPAAPWIRGPSPQRRSRRRSQSSARPCWSDATSSNATSSNATVSGRAERRGCSVLFVAPGNGQRFDLQLASRCAASRA